MRLNNGTIGLLCVVCSMAVVFGTAREALAKLVCCNEVTYECQYGGGGSPQFCPQNCPPGWRLCSNTSGVSCGHIVDICQVGNDCLRDIDEACCLALGGTVVEWCYARRDQIDADVAGEESWEDESLAPGDQLQEELDAPTPFNGAWALAIPAFLFLPVVPAMLRRRRNR